MTLPGRIHVPLALPARALLVCAASFFNSKDLPFLGMFMIALCLTHRAFRKDTVGAFLLCGVGVGILVNLRIMGIVTFPAILAMRGLDLALCTERTSRHKNVYFNFLVDRTTPEQLRTEYEMDPRMDACREGLVVLLERYPGRTLHVLDTYSVKKGWFTLPETDRSRLILVPRREADFRIACGKKIHSLKAASAGDALHTRKVYANTILVVTATRR